jgi:hypothetical protein
MPVQDYAHKIWLITGKSPEDIKWEMGKRGVLKSGLKPSVFCNWLEERFALDFGQSMNLWRVFRVKGWVRDPEVRSKGMKPAARITDAALHQGRVNRATKPSDTRAIGRFMRNLDHPLKGIVGELRRIILNTDKAIGEEMRWRAPSFFYTGKMPPFKTREYKRTIVSFSLVKKNRIALIFLKGKNARDESGLLIGVNSDGRRFAFFYKPTDVESGKKDLQRVVRTLLRHISAS